MADRIERLRIMETWDSFVQVDITVDIEILLPKFYCALLKSTPQKHFTIGSIFGCDVPISCSPNW